MRATAVIRLLGVTALASGCPERPAEVARPTPSVEQHAKAASPCIYFKQLRPFLPLALPGYRQLRDEGSTGKYGEVSVSEAERVFAKEGRELGVRIVDTTLSGKLAEKIRSVAHESSSVAPGDPNAPIFLEGTVGFVRYDPGEDRAEANLLVGDRFVVAVTGRGGEGTGEVRALARQLNLAGLSKLR